ncbi:MAG: helix-hairpin-helix domain-containing protein [Patescibacteria group bacterium]
MDFQSLLDKYKPLFKKYWLPLVLASLGMIFFIYGLIVLIGSSNSSSDVILESANQIQSGVSTNGKEIVIDIEGAVSKPGVYNLPLNSRFQDALVASGGLAKDANRTWVEQNLNLAQPLKDGVKIYIPKIGDDGQAGSSATVLNVSSSIDSISINSASEGELDNLPGIGPVTAQKIINNRPYNSIEDLLTKKVVGEKIFGQIRERITVY